MNNIKFDIQNIDEELRDESISLNEKELQALKNVLEYSYSVERSHYENLKENNHDVENHIFESLDILNQKLYNSIEE